MPQGLEAGGCLTPSSAVAGAVALKRAWFGAPCATAQPEPKRARTSPLAVQQHVDAGMPHLAPAMLLHNAGLPSASSMQART